VGGLSHTKHALLLLFVVADAAGTQLWQQFLGLLSQGCSVLLGAGLTHPILTDRLQLASTENDLPKVSLFTDAVGLNSPSSLVQLTSLQGYAAEVRI
jgi:hypothetical protein